jgi:hypothetical protein
MVKQNATGPENPWGSTTPAFLTGTQYGEAAAE